MSIICVKGLIAFFHKPILCPIRDDAHPNALAGSHKICKAYFALEGQIYLGELCNMLKH